MLFKKYCKGWCFSYFVCCIYFFNLILLLLMFFVSRILVEILKRKKVLRRKSVENRSVSLYTHELHSYVEPEKY